MFKGKEFKGKESNDKRSMNQKPTGKEFKDRRRRRSWEGVTGGRSEMEWPSGGSS